VQTTPFLLDTLEGHLDPEKHAWLEVSPNSREYPLLCTYMSNKCALKSLRFREGGHRAGKAIRPVAKGKARGGDSSESDADDRGPNSPTTLGLGFFHFEWDGHEFSVLHQRLGRPVPHRHGYTDIFTNMVLFANIEQADVLGQFVSHLIIEDERPRPGKVNLFEYNPDGQRWHHRGTCRMRPLDSVVVDEEKKQQLLHDVTDFIGKETRRWYRKHGIPHKRGYLFFGKPGAGKSSIIQALAGSISYNICYVHPTHPKMSDAKLRHCVNDAPKRSLLIFEDISTKIATPWYRIRCRPALDSSMLWMASAERMDRYSSSQPTSATDWTLR